MGQLPQPAQQPRPMAQGMPMAPAQRPSPRNVGIAAGGPPQRRMPAPMPQGMPMAQPQMPQMSPQQMMAGLSVVDDDIEKLDLDAPTKLMLKERELINLASSIQNDKMMQQQPPMSTINDQQQAQIAQMGIASAAPAMNNMMMGGGIVGFAEGGDPEIEQYIRLDELFRKYEAEGNVVGAANVKEEMDLMEVNNPSLRAEAMQQATRDAGFDPEVELDLGPQAKKDLPTKSGKPIKKYAGEDGSLVESDEDVDVTPWYEQQQQALYEQMMADVETYNPEAEEQKAMDLFETSMADADAAQAVRQADLDAVRAQREERFSPEREQKRRRSAALSAFAKEGFGAYAPASLAVEEEFSAGRLQAASDNFQNQNEIVTYLRERGVNQSDAVNAARTAAIDARRGNLQSAKDVINSAVNRATQVEVAQTYADRANKPTNRENDINTELAYLRTLPENAGVSEAELKYKAMVNVTERESQAALGRLGATQAGQAFDVREAATRLAMEAVGYGGASRAAYASAVDKDAFLNAEIEKYIRLLTPAGQTQNQTQTQTQTVLPVPLSQIPEQAKQMLINDPSLAAQFDEQFGAGKAQQVLAGLR
jgi:hypothetical protein